MIETLLIVFAALAVLLVLPILLIGLLFKGLVLLVVLPFRLVGLLFGVAATGVGLVGKLLFGLVGLLLALLAIVALALAVPLVPLLLLVVVVALLFRAARGPGYSHAAASR